MKVLTCDRCWWEYLEEYWNMSDISMCAVNRSYVMVLSDLAIVSLQEMFM